ncbi:MAG: transcriptional regulator [Candidatus Omnitrophota bacterium]|jgi:mRNA-degrading endonuclease RelE of RelBE toxin-antitoxin system|nr:MAG: transcriptional regulator [Candidatus Omnitrophota bacterium]
MRIIETSLFTKLLPRYLDDDEYRSLQGYLVEHPDCGDIIKGSGGVRKMRWASNGKGKRSGVRVIYYWKGHVNEIWMLTIHSIQERVSIESHIVKQIAEEIESE